MGPTNGRKKTPWGARPGSLIVTVFMISIGVIIVVAGISAMLKAQINASSEIQRISIVKLQRIYMAEMALNTIMAKANGYLVAEDPFSAFDGSTIYLKDKVDMAKFDPNPAGVTAECKVFVHKTGTLKDLVADCEINVILEGSTIGTGFRNGKASFRAKRRDQTDLGQNPWVLADYRMFDETRKTQAWSEN